MTVVTEGASEMAENGSDNLAQRVAECMRQAPWTIPFEKIEEWAMDMRFSPPPGFSDLDAKEALANELHAAARRLTGIAEDIYHFLDSFDAEEKEWYFQKLDERQDRRERD